MMELLYVMYGLGAFFSTSFFIGFQTCESQRVSLKGLAWSLGLGAIFPITWYLWMTQE